MYPGVCENTWLMKLIDEVCASHTKRLIGENRNVLVVVAEVLLTGLTF